MTWLAFIDESGDHGLENIDPNSTTFALSAIIYDAEEYLTRETVAMARMKHAFWAHEGIILHCYDLKKKQGPFSICTDKAVRDRLMTAIGELFAQSTMKIISAVIDKEKHKAQYVTPADCYYLTVQFVLERIYSVTGPGAILVFESRGKAEDSIVRKWVQQVSNGANYQRADFKFSCHFAKKSANVAGLQMADLACDPIIHFTKVPDTKRPDWLAVMPRMWRGGANNNMMGFGLKTFP